MSKIVNSTWFTVFRYLLIRVLTIGITIFIGVFITISIANKTGQIDANVRVRIEENLTRQILIAGNRNDDTRWDRFDVAMAEDTKAAGLDLPYYARNLRWTFNALRFDWGDILFSNLQPNTVFAGDDRGTVETIILERFPNTLLLIGVAYFLVFTIGIPLALFLSRQRGHILDRLIALFAPLSAIPAWVHGILLILIFALELQLLPLSGMLDLFPPKTEAERYAMIAKHLILPVTAIVLGLLFQLVYAWRTFFLIYSQEDYVELAKAQGLSPRRIERKYIFRPTAPYIITSFALTLVNFWQTTTAVELVFDWPGIGKLYIDSLPNFFGESMFPGEMVISVGLVVVFAYMLGGIILLLDFMYLLVDPRIRLSKNGGTLRLAKKKKKWFGAKKKTASFLPKKRKFDPAAWRTNLVYWRGMVRDQAAGFQKIFRELLRYPSAVFGMVVIFMLIAGSTYAFFAMPYNEVGLQWYQASVTGKSYVPRYAWPEWVNAWRDEELLSTIVLDSQADELEKEWKQLTNTQEVAFTYRFDYDYEFVPQELFMYFDTEYVEKSPFVFIIWTLPDGSEIELKGMAPPNGKRVDIIEFMPRRLNSLPEDFDLDIYEDEKNLGNGAYYYLFDDPTKEGLNPQKGTYTVRIEALVFEDEGDVDAQLVLLGNVFGPAGTDFRRRDLMVPLLWGMPFALIFGLAGAVFTTVVSIVFSAMGVWFGGWVDTVVQRVAEATMILPVLGVGVLLYAIFNVSLWVVLAVVVVLNAFGSPIKTFRAAFLQIKGASYIEAAKTYGASDRRVIFFYMIPKIMPMVVPQLVTLIPSYVFLEATLGMFNIKSIYPTWGKVIFEALREGVSYGSRFWVLEPIALLLITGFAFAMLGYALDRVLNPKLMDV